MSTFSFEVTARDPSTAARRGTLVTSRGTAETPVFMPVATHGFMRAVPIEAVERTGAPIVLANTYHLFIRPGPERVAHHGGLHDFMAWPRSILTDSGGFQITSLADYRRVTDDGIWFKSHTDGREHFFDPERVMGLQADFGVDIAMVLDECTPHPYTPRELEIGLDRTIRWAERAARCPRPETQARFCITQGGTERTLRRRAARELGALPFEGIAIGGLGIGEGREEMYATLTEHVEDLDADRPRYLMGVGPPRDLVEAVAAGVDMFDCVIPTRHGRNGTVYSMDGALNIKNARFATDLGPLDEGCDCPACTRHSRSFLNHLFKTGDALSGTLLGLHNLHFFQRFMAQLRASLDNGTFADFRTRIAEAYPIKPPGKRPLPPQ